jgi:hypothetical protein
MAFCFPHLGVDHGQDTHFVPESFAVHGVSWMTEGPLPSFRAVVLKREQANERHEIHPLVR